MIRSRTDRLVDIAIYVSLGLLAFVMLFPFINVAAKSFSSEAAVLSHQVTLWPVGFTLKTYSAVLHDYRYWQSFYISVAITVVGTLLHVLVMSLVAYPLSRDHFRGGRLITLLFVFIMYFNGGLIPTYLIMKSLHLTNTLGSLIFPGLVSTFNMIILRNYFMAIPDSLEESARLDGCSNFGTFFRIVFPLSLPAIATVCVYTAVGFWNSYFNALIYLDKKSLYPLALYLREIVVEVESNTVNLNPELTNINPQSMRAAAVIAATVPILLIYPLLQRYFVQGVMLGAVKE
jgi:putative aldouronate transport system permease protein